jgi:superfamily II DNA or RNA helicase
MKIDHQKRLIADAFIKEWSANGCIGTANVATGLGKTFIFLDACSYIKEKSKKRRVDILFLAETNQREKDLLDDISEYRKIYGIDHSDVRFACYQSACRWRTEHYDLVGADEIHFSMTPEYVKFYENNTYDAIIGLSATVDSNIVYTTEDDIFSKKDLLNKICPVIFRYDMNTAILEGVKKNVDINVIFGTLDSSKKNIEAGNKTKRFYQSEKDAYQYAMSLFQKGINTHQEFLIKRAFGLRSRLLYSLPSKVESVKRILSETKKTKTLIFNNNLEALESITPNVIRSPKENEKKSLRDELNVSIRKAFDDGDIYTIGSFKLLQQGANLNGIERVILMSYYSDDGKLIQRIGRLRNGGEVIVLVTANTQEEKWFSEMMQSIDPTVVTVNRYLTLTDYLTKHRT